MSYLDRLRPARYRSPSGVEFEFAFRDLQRAGGKKAAVHELPQQDLPEVQDLGQAATHFAIEALFREADYDLSADAFWGALAEHGPGTLLHPRWGNLLVLPVTVAQREGFVDGMRQAIFEVDFVRTGTASIPATAAQAQSVIAAAIQDADDAITEAVAVEPEDAAQAARVENNARSWVAVLAEKIRPAISAAAEIREQFDAAVRAFNAAPFSPQALAGDLARISRLAAQAETSILAKMNGYGAVIELLGESSLDKALSVAEAAGRALNSLCLLLGLSESSLTGTLTTRAEAVTAAELAQDSAYAATESIEQAEAASGYLAPEEVLAAIKAIMAQTAAMLLERSFSLAVEQRIVLEADRTPLDLIYELAAPESAEELEAALDTFIENNHLAGDELLLIPRGREITYYAA